MLHCGKSFSALIALAARHKLRHARDRGLHMKRALMICLAIVAAVAVPAMGQIRIQTIPRAVTTPPATIQTVAPQGPQSFDPAMTPETARAAIAKLQARNRELKKQMGLTLGDLQALRTQLDELTRAGGSLVRAQCISASLSRRTDGAGEENCAASGYTCGPVEGTCRRSCTSSDQCAGGFVCDIGAARCVVPATSDD
jgi:hypothetical protein